MPVEIIMPKVDMDMTTGKVMTWHVKDGDHIEKGVLLFDIETDKAAMEVEAEADGIIHHRTPEGTEVAIGQPVAWLYASDEEVGDPPQDAALPAPEPEVVEAPAEAPPTAFADQHGDTLRATPSARRAAREAAVPLDGIPGTGPRGRIQKSDIEALVDHPSPPAAIASETGPLAVSRYDGPGVPIVMIHGFAGDAMTWAAMDGFLNGRPSHRIDLPSHGKSPLRQVRDFTALAKEVREAVDALHLDAFDLVGHSLGGALALALADVRPKRLCNLTLLAPAGLGPEVNGTHLTGICNASRPESIAPWLKALVWDDTLITDAFARLAHAARTAQMRAAQAAMADALFPDSVQTFDLRPALGRLTVPTRIIWGKQDQMIPWKHALAAPGPVALHLFERMGHIPHLEAPETVGRLISTPLQGVT